MMLKSIGCDGFFKKAEDMIGTPKENSNEQLELFQKAIEIKPDFLEAHYNLGLIYGNRKQMKEASVEFEKVLKLDPKFDPNIYFLLASAYQDMGNTVMPVLLWRKGFGVSRRSQIAEGLAYLQFNGRKMKRHPDSAADSRNRADGRGIAY